MSDELAAVAERAGLVFWFAVSGHPPIPLPYALNVVALDEPQPGPDTLRFQPGFVVSVAEPHPADRCTYPLGSPSSLYWSASPAAGV
jgi:hypothetical protein